jgi:hypothetical protein
MIEFERWGFIGDVCKALGDIDPRTARIVIEKAGVRKRRLPGMTAVQWSIDDVLNVAQASVFTPDDGGPDAPNIVRPSSPNRRLRNAERADRELERAGI